MLTQRSAEDATNSISEPVNDAPNIWRHWCRLCAKDDDPQGNIKLFIHDEGDCDIDNSFVETIREYLGVNIKSDDLHPKEVCIECSLLVEALKKYSRRVQRVQELFDILQSTVTASNSNPISDTTSVRRYFEIDNDGREHSLLQQLLPEVNDIAARPTATTYQTNANVQSKPMKKNTKDKENIETLKQPEPNADEGIIEILKPSELQAETEDEEIIEILKQSELQAETEDEEIIEILQRSESKAENDYVEIMVIVKEPESKTDQMVEVWVEPLEQDQEDPHNNLVLDSDSDCLIEPIYDIGNADDYSNDAFENSRDYYDATINSMQTVSRLQLVPISKTVDLTTRPNSRKRTKERRSNNSETYKTKKMVSSDQNIENNTVSRRVTRLHAATLRESASKPRCPICQKRFSKKSFVQIHINTKHASAEPYLCTKSGTTFQPNIGIREHLCDELKQNDDERINEAERKESSEMSVKQKKSFPCTMRKKRKRNRH